MMNSLVCTEHLNFDETLEKIKTNGGVAVLVAVPGFLRLRVGFHVHTDIA